MTDLTGRRILIVEDEYFIADDLARVLRAANAVVIGPAPTPADALKLIAEQAPDIAVLDINLRGEASFELADELDRQGLPFVFATGYDRQSVPDRHANRLRWQKPYNAEELVRALRG